ncbi:MAG TPA: SDR family NAD(P)-dependent oxidoreductase [Candidatus Acidoferrum sp.]|jgi:NAD(P)-dependent dehydrogenase (short-subunit alcohol dehydrogenase family)|nr:SDR family NAD(P)-dependent oxidoreductase [Candidatus Acidoferrum sp.]
MRLKDKVILVTGSTSGIGQGMVRVFASEGARVVVHGMAMEDAAAGAAEIKSAGGQAEAVAGMLDDPAVPRRVIDDAAAKWGRLDALANNAATTKRGNLDNTDAAEFDRVIATNLRAPFLLIQRAMHYFRKQGGGRVINIGSVNAYCGEKNLFAYSISKAGLATLTRNLADAHGAEGLRIQQFNVGWTLTKNEYETKIKDGLPENWPSNLPKEYAPSGRLLSPEDIAWAAVYFLSDEAPLVNGAILDFEQYPVVGRNPTKQI